MVQTFAADGADQAFHEGILPGRTRRRDYFLDVQAGQAVTHLRAIDAITVADQVAWCRLERKGLAVFD
jgi:hypothetical protein